MIETLGHAALEARITANRGCVGCNFVKNRRLRDTWQNFLTATDAKTFEGFNFSFAVIPRLDHIGFSHCNLRYADFSQADGEFKRCGLKSCDLRGANLSGVAFYKGSIEDCDLRNANLSSVRMQQGGSLDGSLFGNCSDAGDIRGATSLKRVDLYDGRYTTSNSLVYTFQGSDLRNSKIEAVFNRRVDFRGALVWGADFSQSVFKDGFIAHPVTWIYIRGSSLFYSA